MHARSIFYLYQTHTKSPVHAGKSIRKELLWQSTRRGIQWNLDLLCLPKNRKVKNHALIHIVQPCKEVNGTTTNAIAA